MDLATAFYSTKFGWQFLIKSLQFELDLQIGHIVSFVYKIYISVVLLKEILHHLGCIKPWKKIDKVPTSNWCRISSQQRYLLVLDSCWFTPPLSIAAWINFPEPTNHDASHIFSQRSSPIPLGSPPKWVLQHGPHNDSRTPGRNFHSPPSRWVTVYLMWQCQFFGPHFFWIWVFSGSIRSTRVEALAFQRWEVPNHSNKFSKIRWDPAT